MSSAPFQLTPTLLRVGDIGVATEWRSLVLDWTALLTELGTDIYTYLRDDYDHQRTLWPLLVPQGPTKRKIQVKLGRKSATSLHGPEYLLAVVGLVTLRYVRGAADPEHPNRTHVASYCVGKLDYPQLNWPMLSHVLDALMEALDPEAPQQRQAQHALRSLARSGLFQPCDPGDVFYDFGAWPTLLPRLIADARWETLFAHLHGPAAIASYRAAARAWCGAVARTMERRSARNQIILDTVQGLQREPSPPSSPSPIPRVLSVPAGAGSAIGGTTVSQSIQAADLKGGAYVPAIVPASPQGADLSEAASGTGSGRSPAAAVHAPLARVPDESHAADQCRLINRSGEKIRDSRPESTRDRGTAASTEAVPTRRDSVPGEGIGQYLRDDELASVRLDGAFWCTVNQILRGVATRYPYTAGERKALQRQFQRAGVPIGVVLAALRAVMDTATPPTSLAAALVHPVFQDAVAQARTRVPHAETSSDSWSQFLWTYRTVASTTPRQVSPDDHRQLHDLFQQQAEACWMVLDRIAQMPVPPPRLSPHYVARAVRNNLQAGLPHSEIVPPRATDGRADDAQPGAPYDTTLLDTLDLRPRDLQPFAPALVQAWLEEYERRRDQITRPRHWVLWGLRSGITPALHPDLKRRPLEPSTAAPALPTNVFRAASPPDATDTNLRWSAVLSLLRTRVGAAEFETWLTSTTLVHLDSHTAAIGVNNVFTKEQIDMRYRTVIVDALQSVVGQPLSVEIVIAPP